MVRVLVIDDNLDFLKSLEGAINKECDFYYKNKDFFLTMDYIKEIKPDVIVLDIKLNSNENGIDILKEVKKNTNIPVIGISGANQTQKYKNLIQEAGFDIFIAKPFKVEELLEVIQYVLS